MIDGKKAMRPSEDARAIKKSRSFPKPVEVSYGKQTQANSFPSTHPLEHL